MASIPAWNSPISGRKRLMSTNVGLLGMLALKLGRSIEWDGKREEIIGDAEANKLLQRDYRTPWQYRRV